MRGRAGETAAAVLLATIALTGYSTERAAAQLDEHEYDLMLPEPDGANGEVGPVGESSGEGTADDASTSTTVENTATPAPTSAESVAETPVSEATADRSEGSEDPPDGPRYPRGETFALGPAELATAAPPDAPGGEGKPGIAIAIIAGASGGLVAFGAWRMRVRNAGSGG